MSKSIKKIYEREVKDVAHKKVMNAYKDAIAITDGVYLDILKAMRDEIDKILTNQLA
jgi:hypothetical protein